jgi:hypothetical protein
LAWTGSGALPEGRDRTCVGGEKDGAALRVNCATDLEKSGFALDSLLEGDGFEPPVPHHNKLCVAPGSRRSRLIEVCVTLPWRELDSNPGPP